MYSAVYYPHTKIRSESLLKTALLLWDEIHVIVPWENYQWDQSPNLETEAFKLIGKTLLPSDREKQQVHDLVEDFATRPLPAEFRFRTDEERIDRQYEMFGQKLLPETWGILREASMAAHAPQRHTHYRAPMCTGLALMSLLADCCAGNTLARVTDRGEAYASLAGLLLEGEQGTKWFPPTEGGKLQKAFAAMTRAEEPVVLIPLALEVADINSLTLAQLIRLRKQEHRRGGTALRDLRHRFADRVSTQALKLSTVSTDRDLSELKRQFQIEMQYDYENLSEALELEKSQLLGSKEVIFTALIAAAEAAAVFHLQHLSDPARILEKAGGAAILLGGLYSSKGKFAATRRKVLRDHPTAYLYEAQGSLRP